MERKSKRNFTEIERETLLLCIESHKEIINNKKTNSVTNGQKQAAWLQIERDFNSMPSVTPRDVDQLKSAYKNLKQRATKKRADERVQIFKTGGGSNSNDKVTDFEARMLSLGAVKVPLSNSLDDDAEYMSSTMKDSDFLAYQEWDDRADSPDSDKNSPVAETIHRPTIFSVRPSNPAPKTTAPVPVIATAPVPVTATAPRCNNPGTSANSNTFISPVVSKPSAPFANATPGPSGSSAPMSFLARKRRRPNPHSSMASQALKEQADARKAAIEKESELGFRLKMEENEWKRKEHEARMEVLAAQAEFYKTMTAELKEGNLNFNFMLPPSFNSA